MKQNDFNSLGKTNQLKLINRLENINGQKQALISDLEKEIKVLRDKLKPWLKQGSEIKSEY